MASKSYWRKKQEQRSARGRRGAEARWARAHAEGPVRASRWVEIEVRCSDRPLEVVRLRQDELDDGRWSRFVIEGTHGRRRGANGVGKLVAALIA